jgi:hypothetical protein
MYFHLNIHALVNLMQIAYHSPRNEALSTEHFDSREAQNAAILIFFCTLQEALLENLLLELCRAQQLSNAVTERLLSDNWRLGDRQGKLWFALTGEKWKTAIERANVGEEIKYADVNQVCTDVLEKRNRFVHTGASYIATRELADKCVTSIWGVISMYVALHNAFVHPLCLAAMQKSAASGSNGGLP